MKKSPIPEEVRRSFDQTVMLINDLTAEAADIKQKFGERSKLLEKKLKQIETLRAAYTSMTSYIEHLIKANTEVGVQMVGLELMLVQKMYGMTFSQAAKLLGYDFSQEFIESQDKIDAIISKLTKLPKDGNE